jgi:hypothetical protein
MSLTDLEEVTPSTSSAEIQDYAKSVIEEINQDRQGEVEKKSDAQITSEHAGIQQPGDKTPAEDKSGSNTATDDGEESGNAQESIKWLTDDVKAEAAAYGINEADLADFASREELDRVFRLFDKSAIEAGRKALAKGEEEGTTRNEKGQFVKQGKPKTEPLEERSPKDGAYKVSLDADIYDDGIISELTRMNDHYASRLEAIEARYAEASVISQERHFDSLVDSLGHADLFGATDKETAEEKQRREDLFVEVETYLAGRKALGRPAELNEIIVNRIAKSLFADELRKKELKQRTQKISKQSNGRLGGSPTKPLKPSDNPQDHYDRLYREMSGN